MKDEELEIKNIDRTSLSDKIIKQAIIKIKFLAESDEYHTRRSVKIY